MGVYIWCRLLAQEMIETIFDGLAKSRQINGSSFPHTVRRSLQRE